MEARIGEARPELGSREDHRRRERVQEKERLQERKVAEEPATVQEIWPTRSLQNLLQEVVQVRSSG